MKNFKLLLYSSLVLFFASCEKEDSLAAPEKTIDSKYTVRNLSKHDLFYKENILEKINPFEKKLNRDKTANKGVYVSEYDFYIDTDNVKYIEDNTTSEHSYVFPINELDNNPHNLRNLLLSSNKENDYDVYIVEYGFTQEEYPNLSIADLSQRSTKFYKVDLDSSAFTTTGILNKDDSTPYQICIEVWEQVLIPNNQGDNIGGEPLYEWGETLIASQCQVVGGGGGNGSGGDGGSTGGGDGSIGVGGSSGNGSGTTPYTDYSPIISTVAISNEGVINGNLVNGFINGLEYSEKNWWNNVASPTQKTDIISFLLNNKTVDNTIDPNALQVVNEMISLATQNGGSFSFNNLIDPNNSLSFENTQELKDHINDLINSNVFSIESYPNETLETSQNGKTKLAKRKVKLLNYDAGIYIYVKFKTNSDDKVIEILDVSTTEYGFSVGEWVQTNDFYNPNGSNFNIELFGGYVYDYTINGWGVTYTSNFHIMLNLNENGEITGVGLIPLF